MDKLTLLLSFFLFSISYTFGQTVVGGDFEASTGWNGCQSASNEIGPESAYGGSSSQYVCEIDTQNEACQSISGFTIGETYELSISASRRVYAPAPTSTPDPVDATLTIGGGVLSTTIQRSGGWDLTVSTFQFTATQITHQLFIDNGPLNTTTFGLIIDDISISVATVVCSPENGVLSIGN